MYDDVIPERRSWLDPGDHPCVEVDSFPKRCTNCAFFNDEGWCTVKVPAWVDVDFGCVQNNPEIAEECECYKERH
jgi:hypothetical protein